jgi:hypothetical protein
MHYLFALALIGRSDFKRAEFELETALLCNAEPEQIAEAKAKLTDVRAKLGKRGKP